MSTRLHFLEQDFTVELTTPLHIGTGEPDGTADAGVVRDFNGLPGLPGASLQGVLRSAYEEVHGKRAARAVFGYSGSASDRVPEAETQGMGGRLWVSWGVIHNQDNRPQRDRITASRRDADPVLLDAAHPLLRDHVCLNERGVAVERGKFDELVVSAGHRFTFTLRLAQVDEADLAVWEELQEVLRSGLRIGGKTRRGLGAFEIKDSPNPPAPSAAAQERLEHVSVRLLPEGLWMFGGGLSADTDSAPVAGTRIVWTAGPHGEKGEPQTGWIVPGSAVKGALAHRTCFYANLRLGNFADQHPSLRDITGDRNPSVRALFGCLDGQTGVPGRVFIDDVFLPSGTEDLAPVQNHVAINPFTGGARESALFDDQPLHGLSDALKPLTISIGLRPPARNDPARGDFDTARKDFDAALGDLCAGRLPLGAHAGRGYGIFKQTT